jgi:hypothetical protein
MNSPVTRIRSAASIYLLSASGEEAFLVRIGSTESHYLLQRVHWKCLGIPGNPNRVARRMVLGHRMGLMRCSAQGLMIPSVQGERVEWGGGAKGAGIPRSAQE